MDDVNELVMDTLAKYPTKKLKYRPRFQFKKTDDNIFSKTEHYSPKKSRDVIRKRLSKTQQDELDKPLYMRGLRKKNINEDTDADKKEANVMKPISQETFNRLNKHSSNLPKTKPLTEFEEPPRKIKYKNPVSTKASLLKAHSTQKQLQLKKNQEEAIDKWLEERDKRVKEQEKWIAHSVSMAKALDTDKIIRSSLGECIRQRQVSWDRWLILKKQEVSLRQSLIGKAIDDMENRCLENLLRMTETEAREIESILADQEGVEDNYSQSRTSESRT